MPGVLHSGQELSEVGAEAMTREDAERSVWEVWGGISERDMGCAMRLAAELTEEYVWGWIIALAPVNAEECRRTRRLDRFACERRQGRSLPIGTKGLHQALPLLGVVTEADWNGTPAEVHAMWSRLMTRST
jgi:hypothetical protein